MQCVFVLECLCVSGSVCAQNSTNTKKGIKEDERLRKELFHSALTVKTAWREAVILKGPQSESCIHTHKNEAANVSLHLW